MYQRILVPVDGSPTSTKGLGEAIALAKLTGAHLRLIHVIDELSFAMSMEGYVGYVGDWVEELRVGGRKLLQEAQAKAQAEGVQAETVLRDQLQGAIDQVVIAEAASWPADLIVIGTHGRRGIGRMLLGSSAESILRHASVPVLLVRGQAAQKAAGG